MVVPGCALSAACKAVLPDRPKVTIVKKRRSGTDAAYDCRPVMAVVRLAQERGHLDDLAHRLPHLTGVGPGIEGLLHGRTERRDHHIPRPGCRVGVAQYGVQPLPEVTAPHAGYPPPCRATRVPEGSVPGPAPGWTRRSAPRLPCKPRPGRCSPIVKTPSWSPPLDRVRPSRHSWPHSTDCNTRRAPNETECCTSHR